MMLALYIGELRAARSGEVLCQTLRLMAESKSKR